MFNKCDIFALLGLRLNPQNTSAWGSEFIVIYLCSPTVTVDVMYCPHKPQVRYEDYDGPIGRMQQAETRM